MLDEHPFVTVQLPIFNEANVVERLLRHVAALAWPRARLEVQVLDDSTDETRGIVDRSCARYRAAGLDVQVRRRDDRRGFKAGALTAGMQHARGELLAIFDADFAPAPDFLTRVVPHFRDPRLAFAQGSWSHLNRRTSLLTRVQAMLLDAHFFFEHTVRCREGLYLCFSGTAGFWRRSAIDDAGGWQADTLIEDADLSYRAQLRGWRGLHLPDVVVPCELPDEVHAWKSQQERWAKGNVQVARKLLVPILRGNGTRIAKLDALCHLTANCNFPLVVLMALLFVPEMLVRGVAPHLVLFDAVVVSINVVSGGLYVTLGQREAARITGTRGPLHVVWALGALGLALSIAQAYAVITGCFTHDRRFLRTPKAGNGDPRRSYAARASRMWRVELAAALYYLCALGVACSIRAWAALPFIGLFGLGYGLLAFWSMRGAYAGVLRAAQLVDVEQ